MTLIPALTHADELAVPKPSIYVDEIAEAVLALKKNPDDDEALSAVSAYGFLDVGLVRIEAYRAENGHITLSYAVEDYRQGEDARLDALFPTMHLFGKSIRPEILENVRLHRRSHPNRGNGKRWSQTRFDAMREGVAHDDPAMFTAIVPLGNIVLHTRTRFHKGGTSPAEFAVNTAASDIYRIS